MTRTALTLAIAIVIVPLLSRVTHAQPAAGPRWWQQFYAVVGYRRLMGLNDGASTPSYGLGYRLERPAWGVDLALFDVQVGLDDGLHEVMRLTAYLVARRSSSGTLWLGAGGAYGFVSGWTDSDVPARSGHGADAVISAGYDLARQGGLAAFTQIVASIPLYTARDVYDSADSATHVTGITLMIGARF